MWRSRRDRWDDTGHGEWDRDGRFCDWKRRRRNGRNILSSVIVVSPSQSGGVEKIA